MDLDDPPHNPPSTRPHDRPIRAPSGPRIPARPRYAPGMGPPSADPPASPLDSPGAELTLPFPAPTSPPNAAPSPPPSTATPQKTPATTFVAPPPLTPPSAISFESTPIPWKGLPLDAAQWTFSSSELQEIVSKAIRLSARDSFVRLLSLQALEVDIVHESERLDAERLATQAKWRFEAGRRTMLMQALNACAAFSALDSNDSGNSIGGFVTQLASSVKSCDTLLSTMFHISDQQSQIALVQHQHWASALGMALRKLNSAHERQAQELKRAQARVQTLEDELEEAWREAEKMAIEFDDLEQEIAESEASDDVVEGPEEEVHADPRPGLDLKQDPDETGTLGDVTIHTDIAVVLGVTATAVASKATLVTSPVSPKFVDKSDTRSIRSVKSTRSRRDGPSHLSRLSSARVRSRAASNASLRLPKALRSAPSTHTSPVDTPPIPALLPPNAQDDSFLDMESIINEHVRKAVPPQRHPEPTLVLPTPPHSAGLPPTRVPSIWLETDGGKSTRLNSLDRSHSFHIFSSFTARKARRSNLVMSLAGSDRSSDGGMSTEMGISGTGTASPTSNNSPVSLPTHALAHFRGPSLSSSDASYGAGASGVGTRPGSAGARLTTTRESETRTPVPVGSPKRSLVSRASSVILRRLSQATMGGSRASKGVGSPARLREASRLVERWREDGEGEVMLIGSLRADPFDAP